MSPPTMAQKPLKEANKTTTKLVVASKAGVDTAKALRRLQLIGEAIDELLDRRVCSMTDLRQAVEITKEIVVTEAILTGGDEDDAD